MKRAPFALLALFALACGPESREVRSQWLVTLGTDAPVPALGDRLLVELLADDGALACSACRRLFGVPAATDFPLSFGVVATPGITRLRARLFRSAIAGGSDGLPTGAALIDFVGELPEPTRVTDVNVLLSTACFGQPADPVARTTCLPTSGTVGAEPLLGDSPLAAAPGSSPLAVARPCTGDAPPGMLCVPGGLFVLGSTQTVLPDAFGGSSPEHLVVLDPFALDVAEVTVGSVRSAIAAGTLSDAPRLRSNDASAAATQCTYLGTSDPSNDAEPVNCLAKALAAQFCATAGKRLPTEAEWEFAAGNRELETAYPWGSDDDVCDEAVVGRGDEMAGEESSTCRTSGPTGILPVGTVAGGNPHDVTALGLLNLGGNVAEFAADEFADYDEPCWNATPILVDPLCTVRTTNAELAGGATVSRGGNWSGFPAEARVTTRSVATGTGENPQTGFRCALSLK